MGEVTNKKTLKDVISENDDEPDGIEKSYINQVIDLLYDRDCNTDDGDITDVDRLAITCAEMAQIYAKASFETRDYLLDGYSKAKKELFEEIIMILFNNGLLINIDEARKLGAEFA